VAYDRAVPSEQSGGIVARDLWLARGGRQMLTGAGLTVPPGAVTALIAPSGAGKTTLLRCLNGLERADRGTVELDGVDVRGLPARDLRRRVALVAQDPVMLPGTVRENLAYGLATPPDPAETEAALHAAGLDGTFAARDAGELSGGERARVAIARATVRRPTVLVLDEPTAALDADVAGVVGRGLRALADAGMAVGLAVHDLAFAREFADRLVGLDDQPIREPTAAGAGVRGITGTSVPGSAAGASAAGAGSA
jgi:ABC-type multidrug transport system fused ATPase/permease subunit